jgi:hypothetical protein
MKIIRHVAFIFFVLTVTSSAAQSSKSPNSFGDYMITDSSSTILIPTVYNSSLLSSNKLDLWGNYYANMIFYNFNTDSSRKLFDKDTYIASFNPFRYFRDMPKNKNITSQYVLYRVYNVDRNKNKHIDKEDPAILYVSDNHGDNLKALTTENENVVSIDLFEKQNFALIKIQRDLNKNGSYESNDEDYYLIKLDLKTLAFGNKIEMK